MADRKISDLTALTTPAAGDYLPIVDVSEPAASNKNKRITIEELLRGAPDGTVGAPSIGFESDPNTGLFSAGADQLGIATNGVERVEFGTTEVVFNDGGANYDFRIEGDTNANLFFVDASADTVEINGDVTIADKIIHASDTNTAIRFPAADTVSVETNGSERARIDSSGRLLVGTSTAQGNNLLQVQQSGGGFISLRRDEAATAITAGEDLGAIQFQDNGGNVYAEILAEADATAGSGDYPGRLVFSTTADGASSPTERMRLRNNGELWIHSTGGDPQFLITNSVAAGTSLRLISGRYSGGTIGTGTESFRVYTNGDVQNTNNSYGAISDIKLKENIVDANSQWSDIKALQVRNYNFKEGQTHTQIGLVAQEVELVSPGLVSESPDRDAEGNDLGTVTKSVNYSVLYMKAVKALQEAMERIETLEAKVAALEGA